MAILDSPMKEINGPDLILDLTVEIISRFWGFRCQGTLTYPTRDPRNSNDYAPGPYDHYPYDHSQNFITPFKDLAGSH
jgi:hypothetical protein